MFKLDLSAKVRANYLWKKFYLPYVRLSSSIYNVNLSKVLLILLELGFYFLHPFRNRTLVGGIGPLGSFKIRGLLQIGRPHM